MQHPGAAEYLKAITLGGKPRAMLDLLVSAHPRPVSNEAFTEALWGNDPNGGPDDPLRNITVHVSRLNRELLRFGWQVKADPGRGSHGFRKLFRVDSPAYLARKRDHRERAVA